MAFRHRAVVLITAGWTVGLAACFASAPHGLQRETDSSDAGEDATLVVDSGPPDPVPDSGSDPHAVLGTVPSHGPFTGGQRVLVRGRGFASQVRVWFGATEIDAATIVPVDAASLQVAAPPGKAGPVDVTVQNGDDASTKRTLAGGYVYDAITVTPNTGPLGGGTRVFMTGNGTHFDGTTAVFVDNLPCTDLAVASATELACTTPKDTAGAKPVRATTGSETVTLLDGFDYEDSTNGYEGGLSGAQIAGHLKALVYDNYTGDPIPGAYVIVGAPIESAVVGQTDPNGLALLDDARITAPATLTIAAKCHSPQTFAGVRVDTATIYLDPQFTPDCAQSGDPPPVGGKTGAQGTVTGELVWPLTNELKRQDWNNVPAAANANERRAAYVVPTAYDPTYGFARPSDTYAVTEDSDGVKGPAFTLAASTTAHAYYALAGIEDTTTNVFTAYVMGLVRGVPVTPDGTTSEVYILMDRTLDQVVTLDVSGPTPGPKGPDRLQAYVAVQLQADGFVVVPGGTKSPLLPFSGSLPFVGLPGLEGELAGSSYVTVARAVTGPSGSSPSSVIARLISHAASTPVPVSGFVGVPTLTAPATGAQWDGERVAATFASGAAVDVTVYDLVVGNGTAHWLVGVPGGANDTALPDLSTLEAGALPRGPLTISVIGGKVDALDWDNLVYRNLRSYGMTAYAIDYFGAHL